MFQAMHLAPSKKLFLIVCAVVGITFSVALLVFARSTSNSYIIWGDVFSVGGSEDASSATYKLQDTLGESVISSATSTSSSYGVKAGFRELYPDQSLTLTLSTTSINFGILNISSTVAASHTITVDTNSGLGFLLTVSGNTLTSGAYTIDTNGSTPQTVVAGTEQFGINLVANSSPSIGADPVGTTPRATATNAYGTLNKFAFTSGDTIASSTTDINATILTVSYIANISVNTERGTYSTSLTYTLTSNF